MELERELVLAQNVTGCHEHKKAAEIMQKKYNSLKNDYKGLLDAFEKSEKIRGEQKELI